MRRVMRRADILKKKIDEQHERIKSVPVRVSACYCALLNQSRSFGGEFKKCKFCKEAEKESKPHYKWDWKLNKAVRL